MKHAIPLTKPISQEASVFTGLLGILGAWISSTLGVLEGVLVLNGVYGTVIMAEEATSIFHGTGSPGMGIGLPSDIEKDSVIFLGLSCSPVLK